MDNRYLQFISCIGQTPVVSDSLRNEGIESMQIVSLVTNSDIIRIVNKAKMVFCGFIQNVNKM